MNTTTSNTITVGDSGAISSQNDVTVLTTRSNLGIVEFARLYTVGELTLCQAVQGLRTYVANFDYGHQMPGSHALIFVGHRLTEQDEAAVELGFDGDIDAWFNAGNLPQGWYSLFKDNYPSYCREIKRTYERNGEDAGCDSGNH